MNQFGGRGRPVLGQHEIARDNRTSQPVSPRRANDIMKEESMTQLVRLKTLIDSEGDSGLGRRYSEAHAMLEARITAQPRTLLNAWHIQQVIQICATRRLEVNDLNQVLR